MSKMDYVRERIGGVEVLTRELMLAVVEGCHRAKFARGQARARMASLIDAEAWLDAEVALIGLELPMWHVRRICYDAGEWHCALSRHIDEPDWLDDAIEAQHANLPVALLRAFIDAQLCADRMSRPSAPVVPCPVMAIIGCDNFR